MMTRLFEKTAEGLLTEVDPAKAHELRGARSFSHVVIGIDVLWTDAEEAQRAADMADLLARQAETEQQAAAASARGQAALAKLEALGITADDIRAALAAG